MVKQIENIFSLVAQIKVYFGNVGIYLSIANFLMLLATFKLAYGINISAFLLVPTGFILIIFLGWLDYNLILKYQSQHSNKKNDLKHQLNRIEEKLDKILK
ncbi:MAG: hypothetical protein PF569_07445 [Candidatus Woesearchaeota archaeon]|jgi:hypothetical protein|nr:hypothetical protein [Candidatus Woesearchaeota archaeon]